MTIDEKIRKMREIQERARNPTPVLNKIASDMLKEEQKNFKKMSSPDDVPWKPTSELTNRLKMMRGRNPANILRDRGLLFGSLHSKINEKSAITSTGPEIDYAIKHQKGIGVPARPFAGMNEKDLEKYAKWVTKYLTEGVL